MPTVKKANLDTTLLVVCDKLKSDNMSLENLMKTSSEYDESKDIVTDKNITTYDYKAFIHYYPTSVVNTSSKIEPSELDHRWATWSVCKNIPRDKYIFRSFHKDKYEPCLKAYRPARYLLDTKWVHDTFFEISPSDFDKGSDFNRGVLKDKYKKQICTSKKGLDLISRREAAQEQEDVLKKEASQEKVVPKKKTKIIGEESNLDFSTDEIRVDKRDEPCSNLDNEDEIVEENEVNAYFFTNIPKILNLREEEKFTHDGITYDIETRGKRKYDFIYFKVYDVGTCFSIKDIDSTLHNDKSTFIEGVHYAKFDCKHPRRDHNEFFTYEGLLHIAGKSRSDMGEKYNMWCLKTLFTHQYGTNKDKTDLASNLLSISLLHGTSCNLMIETVRSFFGDIPVIYFTKISKVRDRKKNVMNYNKLNKDEWMYKYGRTGNYGRRLGEHQKDDHFGAQITTMRFALVSPCQLPEAEKIFGRHVKKVGTKVDYRDDSKTSIHQEVFTMSNKDAIDAMSMLKNIQEKYLGREGKKVESIQKTLNAYIEKENASRDKIEELIEKNTEMTQTIKSMNENVSIEAEKKYKELEAKIKEMLVEEKHKMEIMTMKLEAKDEKIKNRDEKIADKDKLLESQKLQFETMLELEKLRVK